MFKRCCIPNQIRFLTGALPEGLTHELPVADEFEKLPVSEASTNAADDLDDLRRQLEALNAADK